MSWILGYFGFGLMFAMALLIFMNDMEHPASEKFVAFIGAWIFWPALIIYKFM